ncbi:JAB domain-containing protein [Aestuariibius insulae]|uniref:JAB domain-containing protein n=1 Tax=Aestuariibius insulae TaxID=2058287 RepID=UPI00398F82BF
MTIQSPTHNICLDAKVVSKNQNTDNNFCTSLLELRSYRRPRSCSGCQIQRSMCSPCLLSSNPERELLESLFDDLPSNCINKHEITEILLNRFINLRSILSASREDMLNTDGITLEIYRRILLVKRFVSYIPYSSISSLNILSSWEVLVEYCRTVTHTQVKEEAHVLYLDGDNRMITIEKSASGTVDYVKIYPREIVKRILELNAISVVLIQNKVFGRSEPQARDQRAIDSLQSACKHFHVQVRGHIIAGPSGVYSKRFQY